MDPSRRDREALAPRSAHATLCQRHKLLVTVPVLASTTPSTSLTSLLTFAAATAAEPGSESDGCKS
eukprot:1042136-Rhodomonas_salina.1